MALIPFEHVLVTLDECHMRRDTKNGPMRGNSKSAGQRVNGGIGEAGGLAIFADLFALA
jgi:hypothetical protein